jgi:hypothetical protein
MLRGYTNFHFLKCKRQLHLIKALNQNSLSNHKTENSIIDPTGIDKAQDSKKFRSKLINLWNSTLKSYNELVGFAEIDKNYQSVATLQVEVKIILN